LTRFSAEAVDAQRLNLPDQESHRESDRVRWRDLDANGHANNVSYLEWLLDPVPVTVREQSSLVSVDVEFRAEALLSEPVTSVAEPDQSMSRVAFRHALKVENQRLLAVAHTVWASGVSGPESS
jgi:medium-chain acyl-[acyl-carrier-protein] hydrolase